jgi:hypothetical protein
MCKFESLNFINPLNYVGYLHDEKSKQERSMVLPVDIIGSDLLLLSLSL